MIVAIPRNLPGAFAARASPCRLRQARSCVQNRQPSALFRGAHLLLGGLALGMDAGHGLLDMAREDVFGRALPVERDLLGPVAFGGNAAHGDAERLQRVVHRVDHGCRLIAAMHHAVGAFLVVAGAVSVPIGLFHQLLEALGIAFAQEIAGTLPAEIVARRIAPRRAVIVLVAGEEIEKERRLAERPFMATAAAEDVAEELLGLAPVEEMRLIGGALIGIARRHGNAVDAARHHIVEEGGDSLGLGTVEKRAVDVDAEAARLRQADRLDRALEDALLTDGVIMHLLVAVEMHRPDEEGVGLEEVELLLHQQRIGAEVDEFLARDDAAHHLVDLAMEQRLTAGDRYYRGAALVDRLEAFLDREALIENDVGIIDLAAAGAGEIAAEQRLQHEHQRVALHAHEALLGDIGADADLLVQRNGQRSVLSVIGASIAQTTVSASSGGMRKRTFSVMPGKVESSTSPSSFSLSISCCTSSAGAEAPAVMPTEPASVSQAGSSASASAMR